MGKRSAPSPATLVVAGLMLLSVMIAAAVITGNNGNDSAAPADEIEDEFEFEPTEDDVVEVTEGSATLKVEYEASPFGFRSSGQDDISLTIKPGISEPGEAEPGYEVLGYLDSTQSVATAGGVGGALCWFNIFHKVQYAIAGTFLADPECRFDLFVVLRPTKSELLSTDCPIAYPADLSKSYMAPSETQKMVFTKAWANPAGVPNYWGLMLVDVALPTGVFCPSFDQ